MTSAVLGGEYPLGAWDSSVVGGTLYPAIVHQPATKNDIRIPGPCSNNTGRREDHFWKMAMQMHEMWLKDKSTSRVARPMDEYDRFPPPGP
jgi:hypothetical protein